MLAISLLLTRTITLDDDATIVALVRNVLLPMLAPRFTSVGIAAQSVSVCNSPWAFVARGTLSLMKVTPWPMNT